ncbi:MAG: hypothetical protein AAFZ15_15485 [Bacteroidota bacterium]
MREFITTLFLVGFLGYHVEAQDRQLPNGFSFGFQLNEFQNDFGIGANVTSPAFLYDKVAVRLRGNLMFHQHPENDETTWTPYANFTFGLVSGRTQISDVIRLYGEGGVIGLLPASDFSTEDFEFGGYGLFGFEFFLGTNGNYFIEIGGVGTGATADKIPSQPIYSNGLLLSVGYRVQL